MKNVPKIGISSLSEIDEKYTSEFIAILTKPIHLPELVDIVSAHFQVNEAGEVFNGSKSQVHEKIDKKVIAKAIELLEGKIYKQWQSTLLTSSFSEIESFAQIVKDLGLKYDIKSLQSFSDVLVMHVKNFDIDSMNGVLKSFPALINELKKSS